MLFGSRWAVDNDIVGHDSKAEYEWSTCLASNVLMSCAQHTVASTV